MKGSIIIVSFFVVGVLLGRFVDIPNLLTAEEPTLYALYALMFLVGISIGSDKKALEALKHQNFKIVLVPLATIIGTLAGSALISLVISGKSLTDCLAVGSDLDIIPFLLFLSLNIKEQNWVRLPWCLIFSVN